MSDNNSKQYKEIKVFTIGYSKEFTDNIKFYTAFRPHIPHGTTTGKTGHGQFRAYKDGRDKRFNDIIMLPYIDNSNNRKIIPKIIDIESKIKKLQMEIDSYQDEIYKLMEKMDVLTKLEEIPK